MSLIISRFLGKCGILETPDLHCSPLYIFWRRHLELDLRSQWDTKNSPKIHEKQENQNVFKNDSQPLNMWNGLQTPRPASVHRPLPLKFHWWASTWRALLVWNATEPFIVWTIFHTGCKKHLHCGRCKSCFYSPVQLAIQMIPFSVNQCNCWIV